MLTTERAHLAVWRFESGTKTGANAVLKTTWPVRHRFPSLTIHLSVQAGQAQELAADVAGFGSVTLEHFLIGSVSASPCPAKGLPEKFWGRQHGGD